MVSTIQSQDNLRALQDISQSDGKVLIKKGQVVKCAGVTFLPPDDKMVTVYDRSVGTIITSDSVWEIVVEDPTFGLES